MTDLEAQAIAADVLHREARFLDERRWDDWLALYHERAVFWVPAWTDEDEYTHDPESEISLIYISSRAQLEERVSRIVSGKSAASTPQLRTAHALANILVELGEAVDQMTVRSIVTTHLFDVLRKEQHVYFSRCEHRLIRSNGGWRIGQKKIVVLNDCLPTVMDFYTI